MNGAFENYVTRQTRRWAVYVAALIMTVGGLALFNRHSTLSMQPHGERANASFKREPPRARVNADVVKNLASEDNWQRNALRYMERLSGVQSEQWTPPPAGKAVSPDVIQQQRRAANARPSVARVVFTPLTERVGNRMEVIIGGHETSAPLENSVQMYLPLTPGVQQIEVAVVERAFLTHRPKAKGRMHVDVLSGAVDQDIVLPLVGSDTERSVFRLHSEIIPKDDPENTLALVSDPIQLDSNGGTIVYEGSVAEMHYGQDLLLDTGERFTAVLVLGDTALTDVVRCIRLDTRTQIGEYAPELPVLAAVVDNRAPVLIHVGGLRARSFHYKVIAIARSEDPTLDLVIAYLGGYLMGSSVNRIPISDAEARRAVEWVANTFEVRLTPADVSGIPDVTVRKIAESLMQATAQSQATRSPKK